MKLKNKLLVILTLLTLLLPSVFAAMPEITTFTVTDTSKTVLDISAVVNQSANTTLFVSTDAAHTSPVYQVTQNNTATPSWEVTGLTPNTDYYIQANATTDGSAPYRQNADPNPHTTLNHKLANSGARTIIALFSFIVVGLAAMIMVKKDLDSGSFSAKRLGFFIVSTLVAALLVANFVSTVLGL